MVGRRIKLDNMRIRNVRILAHMSGVSGSNWTEAQARKSGCPPFFDAKGTEGTVLASSRVLAVVADVIGAAIKVARIATGEKKVTPPPDVSITKQWW
jgi:hypothetical protein